MVIAPPFGQTSNRLEWMDGLKLFAIFLVVLGHVALFYGAEGNLYEALEAPFYLYVYAFHMPLFMTISGYFSISIFYNGGNVKKKFHSLIVPCITLFLIFMVMGVTSQNMWYLKSLFLCYAIVCLYQKYCGGGKNPLHIISHLSVMLLFFPNIM